MTQSREPFTPHESGRLRQVEYTPWIDAMEIAWSGSLDGGCDPNAWPWSDWAAREQELMDRGWVRQALAVRGIEIKTRSASEIVVVAKFGNVGLSNVTLCQELTFESTRCHMGGRRWWFRCHRCSQRRAKLYRSEFQSWACRECLHLTYRSRQDDNEVSRHGGGIRAFRKFLNRYEEEYERRTRRNMRRGLSRWRHSVRELPDYVAAWPVQITGAPRIRPL